jgi:hypothetical protein
MAQMLNSIATMKMKLDIMPNFAKNRLRPSPALMPLPPLPAGLRSDCRHVVHATNPDKRAAARQAMLIATNMTGNPSQIGADRGA